MGKFACIAPEELEQGMLHAQAKPFSSQKQQDEPKLWISLHCKQALAKICSQSLFNKLLFLQQHMRALL